MPYRSLYDIVEKTTGERKSEFMKFKDMHYERIDFEKAKEELAGLIQALKEAKSGEEQFEIHKKYYALTDRVSTQATLCSIRHSIDTTDKFYQE